MKYLKKLMILLLVLITGAAGSISIAEYLIKSTTKESLYYDINEVPKRKVGLLLGTIKTLPNGNKNLYYKYRIEAATRLYNTGKIEYIIVSGDNSRKDYNEPEDMKNDLVDRGIPENKIFMDFAGFRTLDSVVRAREIFGQSTFMVISQKFHNERAIYLAHLEGMEVIGFNAKDVSGRYGLKTKIREKLARVKVFIDYLTGKEPKFLGKKIKIP
ncbi:vancomycin high temperature exclusion protein [Bernardetia sp.]|uniref:SanA/YdcF family protein n=1 Tax=Bernardetia sp. TaxID=1937974 RepID=UPI0025BA288E|nr:ElyC/SanA/YdcF family protein [Bernardetia sp.]